LLSADVRGDRSMPAKDGVQAKEKGDCDKDGLKDSIPNELKWSILGGELVVYCLKEEHLFGVVGA